MSPKFKEQNGFVFKIYSNEEERMHIHVLKKQRIKLSIGLNQR